MVQFEKQALEATKYAELVKLAKQHDVYRRYAPKTEIIEKLMALCEYPLETLNDVSMPSFMENDETDSDEVENDTENIFSQERSHKGNSPNVKPNKASYSSPRVPLLDKEKNFNTYFTVSESDSPMTKSRPSTPRSLRKSLAGPAKPSIPETKLKRQGTFEIAKEPISESSDQSTSRRLTRQRTFDVEDKKVHKMKREGTFDIESNKNVVPKAMKEKEKISVSDTQMLRREGTFEITELKTNAEEKLTKSHSSNLKREGTFEVENTSITKQSTRFSNCKTFVPLAVLTPKAKEPSNRLSQCRQSARTSLKSPCLLKRGSVATPSSVKPLDKIGSAQSVPRRFITSRVKPQEVSPGTKQANKSKVPSRIDQIEKNKVEVSAKKIAEATAGKPITAKKIPDFNAIHKRMFGKMESIVDSRQKVMDKVNSMQKSQQKCGNSKRSPPNTRVVRKLLSPKAGKTKLARPTSKIPTPKSKLPTPKSKLPTPKSKLPTPKPKLPTPKSKLPSPRSKLATPRARAAFQHVASEYASNIVCIQKRPSVGSLIPGVSKLQSPKFEAKGKVTGTTHFGFVKTEPLRKETLKASVMGRKPMKRNSPMTKAKQALQSVRLNKRFELQMKHRMAQQEQGV